MQEVTGEGKMRREAKRGEESREEEKKSKGAVERREEEKRGRQSYWL